MSSTFVIVNNAQSRVTGLTKHEMARLRTEVSYWDQGKWIRTRNQYACRTYLVDLDGHFPTGLLQRVVNFLAKNRINYQIVNNRIVPRQKIKGLSQRISEPSPYPDQLNSVQACLNSSGRGIVVLPTGVGKTRTMKDLILSLGHRALVVPPSSNLKHQTFEYLDACFGSDYVGFYDRKDGPKPITVINYHAITNEDPDYFNNFDVVIWDEFHHASNDTIRTADLSHLSNIYYRFAFTATNYRNDPAQEILLNCVLSETLYSMSVKEAIAQKYIVPVCSTFFNLENRGIEPTKKYASDYSKFIDKNDERNERAVQTAGKLLDRRVPTLILVKHVEHGREIARHLPNATFINGKDENAAYNMKVVEDFNQGKIPQLIGTSVIGEGVDTKACGALINLYGGKARSDIMQKTGRVVRNYPGKNLGFYFDFVDNGSKYLIKHSKQRKKIIESEYGLSAMVM